MKLRPQTSEAAAPSPNQQPSLAIDARRQTQEIALFLMYSFAEWMKFETDLATKAGIPLDALHDARRAAALALAEHMVNHVELPASVQGHEMVIAKYCDHAFSLPAIPTQFAGGPFLTRATPADWALLAKDGVRPDWLEPAFVEWAQSQDLPLRGKPGATI